MRRPFVVPLLGAACLTAAGLPAACSTDHSYSAAARENAPSISIAAANKEVVVGDTTTLTVNSRNTLGRNAHVEWTTTGGRLSPEDNGRIARASFGAPGAYTIAATLIVDGREVARDDVTINVMPIR